MKISIVITFDKADLNIERSFDYIYKQDLSSCEYEVIIVNSAGDDATHRLGKLESENTESVAIINIEAGTSRAEMLNIGMKYCTGDYLMFIRPGDAINPHLFEAIRPIIEEFYPEIISYKMTYAHPKFDMYDDDPFAYSEFTIVAPDNRKEKLEYLMGEQSSECYLCHIYNKSFVDETGMSFENDASEETMVFAYPLMLLAERICYTKDYGYCLFEDRPMNNVTGKVTERLSEQTRLFELLQGIPELYSEYKAEIEAHFVKEYFIKNLRLAMSGRPGDMLKLSTFEVMKYVTLNLVPKWIENDYLFSLNKSDRKLMLLVNRTFGSEKELDDELKKDKLVTVITTTYNRCEKIRESIECILNQSWGYFEYVIVDDGSADRTEDVVKEFKDPRIIFIKNPKNKGLCGARNVGIRNSTGYFIVCQDDDDFCRLDKLEKEVGYFLGLSSEYGMVYCESINHAKRLAGITDEPASILPRREMSDKRKEGYIFPALLSGNFITATAAVYKRSCVEDVGYYDENLFGYEDWDIYIRISKKYEAGFIREPLYDYYQRPGSLISNRDPEHRRKILQSLYDIDSKFVEDRKLYGIETTFKIVGE